ncbi:MFS transporter [Vibrio sp. AND4]|uniref:MFS transporter n=1 Tax=Vibrio sp. AND4 TaxID=314289 RepID=UPI00015F0E59|nr:MFS transporter [Vibrio sp. AND4]EDP57874.1 major facilitator superfamily MFS_1 [Vibrio sp. AND4]
MVDSKAIKSHRLSGGMSISLLCFLAAVFLGILAESFVIFSIPLIVLELTGSASYAGLAFMLEWIPAIVMYPISGLIADRVGPKKTLAISSLARFAIIAASSFLIYNYSNLSLGIILGCAFGLSFLLPFSRVGAEKNVAILKEDNNVSIVHSYVQSSELLAWTLGPALAAYASTSFELVEVLAIAGAIFLMSFVAITFHRVKSVESHPVTEKAGLWFGVSYILQRKPLLYLAVLNCFINFLFAVVISSHAAIITGVFELSEEYYGILNFIGGAFGFANLFVIPFLIKRMSMMSFSIVGLTLLAIGFLVLSMTSEFVVYVMGFAASMVGITLFNIFNKTLRTTIIEQENVGKVMGVFYLINILMLPVGGLVIFLFADMIGNQPIISFTTILLVPMCLLLSLRANKGFD